VDIFTPCADAALCRATETAWRAYEERRWDDAIVAWSAIRSQWPEDQLPALYLARIATLGAGTLPATWDGSTALEKL
jgi:adenylate cyclase